MDQQSSHINITANAKQAKDEFSQLERSINDAGQASQQTGLDLSELEKVAPAAGRAAAKAGKEAADAFASAQAAAEAFLAKMQSVGSSASITTM